MEPDHSRVVILTAGGVDRIFTLLAGSDGYVRKLALGLLVALRHYGKIKLVESFLPTNGAQTILMN
jgi:hypothetical protein